MAEGGGGEAREEEPRAPGPRPPSARDLQVRRAAGVGARRRGRRGRGRVGAAVAEAEPSPDPPGDRVGTREPWVSPGGARDRGAGRNRCLSAASSGAPASLPPPHLQFKKQLLL